MDDNGLGNIIFYIILALIGLAGSFKGKKKKALKPGVPKKIFSWPDLGDATEHSFPDVFDNATTVKPAQIKPREKIIPVKPLLSTSKPKTYSPVSYDEGRYEEPMAKSFSGEGSYHDVLAESYSAEGSMSDDLASRYSHEGSIEGTMAAAFSGEGVSSLADSQFRMPYGIPDSGSSDNEIYGYDYNLTEKETDPDENFNIRKAIIYSVILERKEYSY